jgi:hypothetical protein
MKTVLSFDSFINESKTIEDIVKQFKMDSVRTKFVIGSSTQGNIEADKAWVEKTIKSLIDHYFFNDDYYDDLDEKDQALYKKKIEDFKKSSIKNFSKFFKQWMEVKSDKWRDEYHLSYNKRDFAKNFIKI